MKFWNFTTNLETEVVTLRISGDIVADNDAWYHEWFDDDYTSPSEFRNELRQYDNQPLDIVLETFGGDVFAGLSIAGDIRSRQGRTTGVVHSHCMSIGMSILAACDEVRAMPTAMFMIHSPLTQVYGGINEFEQTLNVLNTIKDSIIAGYRVKTDLSADELSEMMLSETWMTANEAMSYGFVDSIIESETTVTNRVPMNRLQVINSIEKSSKQFNKFIELRNSTVKEQKNKNRLKELALIVETY